MKSRRVCFFVSSTTAARTLLVFRSLIPTTMVLPAVPRPSLSLFFSCFFDSIPPKNDSSTSTGPENPPPPKCSNVCRIRCARNHALLLSRSKSMWPALHTHALAEQCVLAPLQHTPPARRRIRNGRRVALGFPDGATSHGTRQGEILDRHMPEAQYICCTRATAFIPPARMRRRASLVRPAGVPGRRPWTERLPALRPAPRASRHCAREQHGLDAYASRPDRWRCRRSTRCPITSGAPPPTATPSTSTSPSTSGKSRTGMPTTGSASCPRTRGSTRSSGTCVRSRHRSSAMQALPPIPRHARWAPRGTGSSPSSTACRPTRNSTALSPVCVRGG